MSHAPSTLCLAGNLELQDCVESFSVADKTIIALADGAGGLAGAAQAAEFFIRISRENATALHTAVDCENLLHRADLQIAEDKLAGETTAILLVIARDHLFGASIGDSDAWLFSPATKRHLSKSQLRKPLLGSGETLALSFTTYNPRGTLIIASDGLWKYTSFEKIEHELQNADSASLPQRLANLVRLRSGALQDDLAIATFKFS